MCGRYTLDTKEHDLTKRFNIAKVPEPVRENYNVAPSQRMPVITEDESGVRHLETMRWGIPRTLGKDLVKELINTRADKAFGGFWKRTVLNHRCLIPATGFYEWRRTADGKVPYFIHPKDIGLYSFAGIYDIWHDPEGHDVKVYSIITTDANKEMKAVHDRMPVILRPEDEEAWVSPSNDTPDSLGRLLFPFEDGGLEIYQVSKDVNSPRSNDRHLIEPVTS